MRGAALGAILTLALVLRLAHLAAVWDEPFFAHPVLDSQEYDRWARDIAAGDWIGSQAFFQAPLYPYFLAVLYRLFGHHFIVVYGLQILLAVLGCWALYRAGSHIDGRRLGLVAAGLAAIYPLFLFYDVQLLKTSLAVTLISFLLWALAAVGRRPSARTWLAAGVLCGLLSLLRENLLLLVPCLLPLALLSGVSSGGVSSSGTSSGGRRLPRPGKEGWRRCAGLLAGLTLILLPVALRNLAVGGSFLPTSFQGGVNFYIGNNPEADGTYRPLVPGKQIPAYERAESIRLAQADAGRQLTPGEVSRYWLGRSLDWAWRHPGDFLALQLRKLAMFWNPYEWPDAVDYYYVRTLSPVMSLLWLDLGGLTILAVAGLWLRRRHLRDLLPVLVVVFAATVSTVLFFLFSRYRLPAVPGLILLAALPLQALWEALRRRRRRQLAALCVLTAVALASPRLSAFEPRMDIVHFNLGRIAQEEGRHQDAVAHYQATLRFSPRDFLAHLNLGNYAARAGRMPEALDRYERAVAIEPTSDDARANLGGVLLRLGDLERSRIELERALELNPHNPSALHNASLLFARLGDLDEALRLNGLLLEAVPDHPQALRLRARLLGEARRE